MSRYETYKPSGIDWIGEVPTHWEVKRLKNIILNDIGGLWGDEPADDENDIIVLRVADFDRTSSRIIDNPDFTYRNIKASQLDGRLIKQGDILLEKSGGGEQQPVGKAVLFDKDFRAVTSNFINKIETIPSVNNYFALYLFDALYYNNINVRNIKQTTGIQNLDNTGFFAEKISLPPTTEQLTIANYLDDQTQKIDRLIANKKAQAEKLKELRQIEINNAVTKGLNPNAEMKDSGIEWLGKIPKHWTTKRMKDVASVRGRIGFRGYTVDDIVDEGALVIGAKHINSSNQLNFDDPEYISWEKYYESPEIMVEVGDVLIVQRGSVGKFALVEKEIGPATINPSMILLRLNTRIHPQFLFWYLLGEHMFNIIKTIVSSTAVPMISQMQAGVFRIILPPKKEQIEIANYLMERTAAIDQLIKNIEAQIEKLQELRKIKIYEAVTGKICLNQDFQDARINRI